MVGYGLCDDTTLKRGEQIVFERPGELLLHLRKDVDEGLNDATFSGRVILGGERLIAPKL